MADLTVMTWNIQNLFPVGHADGPATQQEYDDKIAGLAEVINAVAPDVLALQEVGPEQVLADLNAACSIDFDHRLVGSPRWPWHPSGAPVAPAPVEPCRYHHLPPRSGAGSVPRPDLRRPGHRGERGPVRRARTRCLVGHSARRGRAGHGDGRPPQVQAHLLRPPTRRGRWQHVRPERRGRALALCRLRALPPHRRGHDLPSRPRRSIGRGWRPTRRRRRHRARPTR